MQKVFSKVLAAFITVSMLSGYFSVLGVFGSTVIASALDSQSTTTNDSNVEFDAYFKVASQTQTENQEEVEQTQGEQTENQTTQEVEQSSTQQEYTTTHEATKNISEANAISLKLNVKGEGYLKDIKITFTGSDEGTNANFKVDSAQEVEGIESINEQADGVTLSRVTSGNEKIIELPISFDAKETINVNEISKQSAVKLEATYVDLNGKEKSIEKTIDVKLTWNENIEAKISQTITKYIPYNVNGNTGVILQTSIKTSIDQNKLPTKETNIQINVPSINSIKPETVKVSANTVATNGQADGVNFTQENYQYNKEDGTLTIKTENQADENANIAWNKNVEDEYLVTYVYSQEALNSITTAVQIVSNAQATITAYNNQLTQVSAVAELNETLTEKLNDLVTMQTSTTGSLSKGYIYANFDADEADRNETIFNEDVKVNISYTDIIDRVIVALNADNYITASNASWAGDTYYKKITINKETYLDLFGEDVVIYILSPEGATYATINQETQADSDGNVVIDISEIGASTVNIQTSKPVKEGNLEIQVEKAIKTSSRYTYTQIKNIQKILTNQTIYAQTGAENIVAVASQNEIALTEPYAKIELELDKDKISTVSEDSSLEMKVILNTSNVNYALYTEPVIDIVLPQEFQTVTVNSVTQAFNDELFIEKAELIDNNGQKTIRIYLYGGQSKYDINAITRGLNITVNTTVKTQELLPNKQVEIKAYVKNGETIAYETEENGRGVVSANIQIVSPTGLVAVTQILDANTQATQAEAVQGTQKATLALRAPTSTEITVKNIILNNYENEITDVKVLGRTIFEGSKGVEGDTEETTTLDAPIKDGIKVEGMAEGTYTIYYSENEDATKDLTNAENAWTTTPASFEDVMSYLVVFNTAIPAGTQVTLVYTAEIPAGLDYGEYAHVNYDVYYKNPAQGSTEDEKLTSGTVVLTTGEGPILEIEFEGDYSNNGEIQEGDIIAYTVKITNKGTTKATGVTASIPVPLGLIYVKENGTEATTDLATAYIGNVEVGESVTKQINFKVEMLEVIRESLMEADPHLFIDKPYTSHEIETYATISCLEALDGIDTGTIKNKIIPGYLSAEMQSSTTVRLKKGDEFEYTIEINNVNEETKKGLTIVDVLPEEVEYVEASYKKYFNGGYTEETEGITYDSKTRTVTFNQIEDLVGLGKLTATIKVKVITENTSGSIVNYAKISGTLESGETKEIETDAVINTYVNNLTEIYNFETNLVTDVPEYATLNEDDPITLVYTLKNTSDTTVNNFQIDIQVPDGLTYVSSKYDYLGVTSESGGGTLQDNKLTVNATIYKGDTLKYTVYLKAGKVYSDTYVYPSFTTTMKNPEDSSQVVNTETKGVTYTIAATTGTTPGLNDTKYYRIMGTAWKDENENGIKEDNEPKMSGIKVMLVSNSTWDFVRDTSGKPLEYTTNDNGYYEFSNIVVGNYTVVFLYDSAYYTVTEYQKSGVDVLLNSDVIESKITIDGEQRLAGLTEAVTVSNQNVYAIDLGLIDKERFDLKVEKYVKSITVQNQTGTATYDYEEEELVKRELVARYIDSTNLIITYKIKITNEGSVGGYAKKIVDYLPKELTFNSELNTDWYVADNNNIYNSSLANEIIMPGETKEITLMLTKKMSENAFGTITNSAEIYESYGVNGEEDSDSIVANKAEVEDDMGMVTLILSVKTGETIMIVGITLAIIAIVGVGIYFIRKKVIEK